MAEFTVQVVEQRVYRIPVRSRSYDEARDRAMELFQEMTPDEGEFYDAHAELVRNEQSGKEQTFIP